MIKVKMNRILFCFIAIVYLHRANMSKVLNIDQFSFCLAWVKKAVSSGLSLKVCFLILHVYKHLHEKQTRRQKSRVNEVTQKPSLAPDCWEGPGLCVGLYQPCSKAWCTGLRGSCMTWTWSQVLFP